MQLKQLVETHLRKLKKQIKAVAKSFDVEDIHHLRVEYKKMRALLRMISLEMADGREIKFSGILKKGYKLSGSIRDLQLHQQQIRGISKHSGSKPILYFNFLRREINKLKPALSEYLLNDPVGNFGRKIVPFISNKFQQASFVQFVQQKWAAVSTIVLSGHFTDNNIHTIRKNLKDLYYNMKGYKIVKSTQLFHYLPVGTDEQFIKQFLDELGNFLDRCVAIAFLESYRINNLTNYKQENLGHIHELWIKEKAGMKRVIVKKLKAIIAPQQLAG